MKRSLLGFVFTLSVLVPLVPAQADSDSPSSAEARAALPTSAEELRELNREHLAIVRRAANLCVGTRSSGLGASHSPQDAGCIISLTDNAVKESGDPQLIAFHFALGANQRYDERRSNVHWQKFVKADE
jgi:hypothetical protein